MAESFDQPPPSPPGPSRGERVWGYAGFWWRVLAWMIDSVILSPVEAGLRRLLGGDIWAPITYEPTGDPGVSQIRDLAASPALHFDTPWRDPGAGAWHLHPPGVAAIVLLLIPTAYFVLLESSRWQATIGKRVCRLRVTRPDGRRISRRRALGRYCAKFLSLLILGFGFLMVAWTRRKQGLHDFIAVTLVVQLRTPVDLVRFNPPG